MKQGRRRKQSEEGNKIARDQGGLQKIENEVKREGRVEKGKMLQLSLEHSCVCGRRGTVDRAGDVNVVAGVVVLL